MVRRVAVSGMLSAKDYLNIVRDRGRRGLPLEDVYRHLFNPALYLQAYGKISTNAGALTPGSTRETADGMSLKKIQDIIALLRQEKYRWTPVRRVYIEKQHSAKKRPLGIPTWSDKLLQEVIRLILDAYYEPQFSDHSHGFRPQRGCHTALTEIYCTWRGTAWFIEGDITACFDSLDHHVLLSILRERLHDNRFLRLIENLLRAGYLEDWKYHATLSGSPQGGIVSPVLSNIYLDRLDQYVEQTLLPAYTRGLTRKSNPAHKAVSQRLERARRRGDRAQAKRLQQEQRSLPSGETSDPDYRRLRYIRYADDFLLGFAGPRSEAEDIKRQIGEYLRESLKLELSEPKTLITHGRTEAAKFLGYELSVEHNDHHIIGGKRTLNGAITLGVPRDVVRRASARYMRNGKPAHRAERANEEAFTIVRQYEAEYRGLVGYYRLALNIHRLSYLKWVMETSLVKTLANKFRTNVGQIYRRYRATHEGRRVLQVCVARANKPPLYATWSKTDLVRRIDVVLNDSPAKPYGNDRNDLVKRLLADTCELCGSRDDIEVHHVHALRDLKRPGRPEKPHWMQVMSAHRRKTLVLCHTCHTEVQHGKPRTRARRITGEPDDAKVSRPVRRGADGKVPA
jgi:group II intron reverse transcriptase/maturase